MDKREAEAFTRPESFALLLFNRDILADLPDLFSIGGYRVLGNRPFAGPFGAVYEALRGYRDPDDPNVVLKGAYPLPSGTAVVDPEMVMVGSPKQIARFCGPKELACQCVLWERVSETALFADIRGGAVQSHTELVRGVESGDQIAPKAILRQYPNSNALIRLIAGAGHEERTVFGDIEGYAFRLTPSEPEHGAA